MSPLIIGTISPIPPYDFIDRPKLYVRLPTRWTQSSKAREHKRIASSRLHNAVHGLASSDQAMSPRRSSRARTSQPTASLHQNTNSSASSVSSGRADHNARPSHKPPSPRSSVAARSQSSGDREGSAKPQPRRTRSNQDDHNDEVPAVIDDENNEEDEEEVTRCICGNQEYPGLPVMIGDPARRSSKSDLTSTALAEDNTGWFIQCDTCKVWQHAGCVGIMDEATCPEEYFCEQCRKDLHRVDLDSNG